jgi:hypothetical protein
MIPCVINGHSLLTDLKNGDQLLYVTGIGVVSYKFCDPRGIRYNDINCEPFSLREMKVSTDMNAISLSVPKFCYGIYSSVDERYTSISNILSESRFNFWCRKRRYGGIIECTAIPSGYSYQTSRYLYYRKRIIDSLK